MWAVLRTNVAKQGERHSFVYILLLVLEGSRYGGVHAMFMTTMDDKLLYQELLLICMNTMVKTKEAEFEVGDHNFDSTQLYWLGRY